MPFAAFMQLALYDPVHGYYSGTTRTGWHGDFVTSPEIDPAFGRLWARAFTRVWAELGEPGGFAIVEIGPGEGGFAAAVLDALPDALRRTVRYLLVERMAAAQERQRARLGDRNGVGWVPSIVDLERQAAAVVFANEVLDNTPVHLVEMRSGVLVEVAVGVDGDRLTEVHVEPSNPEPAAYLDRCGVRLQEGERMEIGLAAEAMARRLAGTVTSGAVFFVDYGDEAGSLAERSGGTLASYSSAGPSGDVVAEPGSRDITSHVNWTAVRAALSAAGMEVHGPVAQADVLRDLGAADLDRDLRAGHDAALAAGRGADAVAALSRRHALRALIDPAGMGGFGVMTGARGVGPIGPGDPTASP